MMLYCIELSLLSLLTLCVAVSTYNFTHDTNRFVRISLVGDISLGRRINKAIHNEFDSNFMDFVSGFANITKTDDLTFANLESSITNHGYLSQTKSNKQFINKWQVRQKNDMMQLCSSSANVNILKYASIDVVTLANNHIFDCTQYGILDTIKILKNYNIDYVGVGDVSYHKQKIIIKEISNVTMGILGFYANKRWFDPNNKLKHKQKITNKLNHSNMPSFIDEHRAKDFLCNDLKYYKNVLKVDLLMVHIHWFKEYIYIDDLTSDTKYIIFHNLVHILSECGVDVIIGSHPHVLIEPEWINNNQNHKTLVLWSLGNFIFDSSIKLNRTHRTCLAQLLIDKNTKKISAVRFREGFISKKPKYQTVLSSNWQHSFCKTHS